MGSVKIGDFIIVTKVLFSECENSHLHKVLKVERIDNLLTGYYPYCVRYNGFEYWVEGIPYSPLMMELV
jgi:hypothetical protein